MKIGMTLSRADLDAPLAEHFGKAQWLLVVDQPGQCQLVRNEGLDGRSVAEAFASRGCTDVIALHLGPGAHARASAAGMRVWRGHAGVSARALARALEQGALRSFLRADLEPGHAHHRHPDHGHAGHTPRRTVH